MVYANAPLFHTPPASGWLSGSVVKVDGGVVVTQPDGSVLSVQPDGTYQSRPAGTAGPYEVAQQIGDKLVYDSGAIYVVPTVGV